MRSVDHIEKVMYILDDGIVLNQPTTMVPHEGERVHLDHVLGDAPDDSAWCVVDRIWWRILENTTIAEVYLEEVEP